MQQYYLHEFPGNFDGGTTIECGEPWAFVCAFGSFGSGQCFPIPAAVTAQNYRHCVPGGVDGLPYLVGLVASRGPVAIGPAAGVGYSVILVTESNLRPDVNIAFP